MFYVNIDDHIQLKLLMANDSLDFFKLIKKNKSHLEPFMPRIKENNSIEDTKRVIELFLKQIIENNGFRAGIIYDGKLIGVVGLKYIDWINRKTEVMYWVDKDYAGKGISTKCVKKIIDISFYVYNLNKVVLKSSVNNKASIRIAEKCGFILEGICKSDELLIDGYTDVCLYGIVKNDYVRCCK